MGRQSFEWRLKHFFSVDGLDFLSLESRFL